MTRCGNGFDLWPKLLNSEIVNSILWGRKVPLEYMINHCFDNACRHPLLRISILVKDTKRLLKMVISYDTGWCLPSVIKIQSCRDYPGAIYIVLPSNLEYSRYSLLLANSSLIFLRNLYFLWLPVSPL